MSLRDVILAILALVVVSVDAARANDATLKALVEITDFTGVSISPNGAYVAFRAERASVEENAYHSKWFIGRLNGRDAPKPAADGGAPIFTSGWPLGEEPRWSADSHWLYFRALRDAQVQIWRASVDGKSEQLTNDPGDVKAFALLSDRTLAYEAGPSRAAIKKAELAEYDAGIRIDRTTPVGQPLFRSGLVNGRLATERYLGDWMMKTTLLADQETHAQILNLETRRVRAATPAEEKTFRRITDGPQMDGAPGRSERMHVADDGRIAYIPEKGEDRALHVRMKGDHDHEIICQASACSRRIAWLSWRGARKEVIFATVDRERGGAMTIFDWDVEQNRVRAVREAFGLLHSGRVAGIGVGCAVDDLYAVCIAADTNTPPRTERIDLDSGQTLVMADPNAKLARALGHRAEFVQWKDRDGHPFTGYFIPAEGAAKGAPSPAFITYYTCQGYLRGGFGDEWPLVHLAKAGIATLCINMTPLGDGQVSAIKEYQTALAGIEGAIDMLARRGVDAKKIGIGGFSFGASVAMWVAYHSKLIATASLATPELTETYYWQRVLMGDVFKETLRRTWGLGAPDETPDQWRRISPKYNLDHLRFPMLIQAPEEEYLVAAEYFAPLIESCAPTDVYVFPNEPHYKFQPRHRLAVYQRNIDWFRFWLLGEGDASGESADELPRWRALKEQMPSGDNSGGCKESHQEHDD